MLASKGKSVEEIAAKLKMRPEALRLMQRRPGFKSYLASLTGALAATTDTEGDLEGTGALPARWEPGPDLTPDEVVEGSKAACVRRLVRIVQTNPDDRVAIQAIDRLIDRSMPKRIDVKEDRVVRMVIEGEEAKRWAEALQEVTG